jgi:YbbR domain-containing protein
VSKFFKILFSNFIYKLIAILLGIIFYYIVQSEQILEIKRKIRVQLIAPEGFVVKGGNTQYKDAMLRGPRALLSHFPMEPILAQIKLFADKPQNIRTRVDREYIRGWNDRIKITIYDAYISAYIDLKIEKELPVKLNILGLPKEGFVVEKTELSHERVFVSGASSDLQRIDSISTEIIDTNNLSASATFDSSFILNDPAMKVVPKRVQVRVVVGEKKINRSFLNIPIEIESANLPFKVTPNRISVVIQGIPSKLNLIKDGEIQAFLNVKDLPAGIHEQKVQIKIPHDSVLIESTPERILIEIYGKKKSL